jgi:hypothetical protein
MRSMKTASLALASFALVLALAPAGASAQGLSFAPPARPFDHYRVAFRWDTVAFGETSGGATDRTTLTSWSNIFAGQVDLGGAVFRLAIPLAYANFQTTTTILGVTSTRTSDQAELGNVELEGLANIDLGTNTSEHRLLIGGGVALPTATDQRGSGGGGGFAGVVVRGFAWGTSFRNFAAWAEQSFTVWPTVEYRLTSQWVLFSAQGSIPIMFPTSSSVGGGPLGRGNVEVMLALDVAVAVRVVQIVDVGVSFLGWALPSGAGYDPDGPLGPRATADLGQTAVTLFVRTDDDLDLPFGAGFEMIFDLDNEWGPTGDDGKLWGARIFATAFLDG